MLGMWEDGGGGMCVGRVWFGMAGYINWKRGEMKRNNGGGSGMEDGKECGGINWKSVRKGMLMTD